METEGTDTYGYCKDNKEIIFDGLDKIHTITIRLEYYEKKYYEYDTNKTKYIVMIEVNGEELKYMIKAYTCSTEVYDGTKGTGCGKNGGGHKKARDRKASGRKSGGLYKRC